MRKPGYFEVEVGKVTMGEVINDMCGGLKEGRELKAVIPGGSSAKVLRADEDLPFTIICHCHVRSSRHSPSP